MKIYRALKSNLKTQGFGIKGTKSNMLAFYNSIGLVAHNGDDWAAKDKEEIRWDCDIQGMVIETSIDSSGGLGVVVNSEENRKYHKHRFWHLKEFKCKTGQVLESGDLIGLADSTGISTGTHLHRDLKECDKNYNTLNKDNGFRGCIDIAPFYQDIYVKDLVDIQKSQISILTKMIETIKIIIASLKK